MKGGFNNPPNLAAGFEPGCEFLPSMKGGFNNPPNRCWSWSLRSLKRTFNEGGVQ